MAHYFDLVLALFPFEMPFFEKYGLRAAFVGHPVIERAAMVAGGEALRARLGIAPDAPLLALLPGSRTSEIRFILPEFRAAVDLLAKRIPGLVTVLPTVPHVAHLVRAATSDWPTHLHIVEGEADKYAAFDAADVALAASGTVTAELALAHTPMVVGYKVGGLTYFLSKFLMTVTHITLINILLEREAVPEFLQSRATPENLAAAVERLFRDEAARAAQVEAMKEFGRKLGEGDEAPSLRAARVLLEFVANGRERMQWKFPDPPNVAVITSRGVVFGGDWIAHVSHDVSDGGWQFHSTKPLNENDAAIIGLQEIAELDPSIAELADLPLGWRAWRDSQTSPWQRKASESE